MSTIDKYELVGDNLTYEVKDFNNNHIIRFFSSGDSSDKLPNATDFISLFNKREAREIYEFSVTNSSGGILILNPGDNLIFRDNIYVLAPEEKKEFMACIFSVEPCVIGVVAK